ncbi:PP0621 family protein [Hydrogenophaga sp.]|jgi:uncharacterized protein|uniref:PP0621 family protein n=1 Tax=Hydrogenophaga sp. TaxID=1904254 RepID=UPI00391C47A9
MKYLLVLAVVMVAVYVWRQNRRADIEAQRPEPPRQPPKAPQTPSLMVTCLHCGTHLPPAEAAKGHLGWYCGDEHRRLHGDRAA